MITEATASERRKTGIRVIEDVPWGTHFCCFYETKQDLLETLVPYFKAGLENNEFCLWVVSRPLTREEARDALERALPDLDRRLGEGALEIHSHEEWYLDEGRCDPQRVLQSWRDKLNQALAEGYAGLRASGDGGWTQSEGWTVFREYEKQLDALIADQRRIILCTYPLTTSPGDQIFDVACIHHVAVARRHGDWEMIETSELKQAKAEIRRLNEELEQKVEERTRELRAANEELKKEIAERKQIESELRESQQQHESLVHSIDGIVWEVDAATFRFTFVSKQAERILGYPVAQWLKPSFWADHLHPEDRDWAVGFCVDATQRKEDHQFEYRMIAADGRVVWLRDHVTVNVRTDQSVRLSGVMFDITERKQAEEGLRRSEEKFKTLFGIAPVGISVLDHQLNIIDANPALERILRLSREELLGGAWRRRTYLDASGTPKPREEMPSVRAVAAKRPFNDVETGIVTESGEIVWTQVSAAPLDLPDASAVVITQDITERKRAAKELEEANRQLRILSRQLFHIQEEERRHLARELHDEIGQTLTAAKINLKIIAPDVPAKIAARLEDSVQLLDRLLRQVRQLSLDLRPPLLDELGLVPTLRWLVDQQAQRAGLRVVFTANVNGLEIDPDVQTACFRVAQEALTNILRHAGAKNVAVELRLEGERLWLSVRDDGAGFDPAVIQQRHAQHSTLGLVSMKERTSLARGGLEIHSAPGQGAEIRAWFPVALGERRTTTQTA